VEFLNVPIRQKSEGVGTTTRATLDLAYDTGLPHLGKVLDFLGARFYGATTLSRPILFWPFWRCPFCCWSIFERTFLAQIHENNFFLLIFFSNFLIYKIIFFSSFFYFQK